ncbi:MAG: DUF1015 domain-containing protein [Phycisphaerales bacterium]
MLRIQRFQAIRPRPSLEARVASVPYDVVDTDEARRLAEGKPDSFLHVVRSEIDLEEGADPYSPRVYAKARENFQRLIADGILFRDEESAIYLYRQVWRHHSQIGVVCCSHVGDYENGLIKRHEKTRPAKEDDRTRHVLAINANAGPVFLAYRDDPTINHMVGGDINARPLYHFVADDGVTHTIWKAHDAQAYQRAFAQLPCSYVADGHHRAASAARAAAQRKSENLDHTGNEEYNWFLTALFPASQLTILPYNRIVRDLNGLDAEAFLDQLRTVATVSDGGREPQQPGSFCLHLDGKWLTCSIDPESIDHADPIASLDVALLHDRILEPILAIGDERTDDRVDFVGGMRGVDHLERLVANGKAALAISMHATTIEQLLSVADAGLIMPPKSTWFEPKLRSGLLVHALD